MLIKNIMAALTSANQCFSKTILLSRYFLRQPMKPLPYRRPCINHLCYLMLMAHSTLETAKTIRCNISTNKTRRFLRSLTISLTFWKISNLKTRTRRKIIYRLTPLLLDSQVIIGIPYMQLSLTRMQPSISWRKVKDIKILTLWGIIRLRIFKLKRKEIIK